MKKPFLFFGIYLLFLSNIFSQVRLARLFSDHMVLQRQKPIPVWGWATADEKVSVSLANQNIETTADKSGKWQVNFLPMEAGGPFLLEAKANSGSAKATDVLLGEVWIASGQSNMEWSVAASNNFNTEKKNANFNQIREFYVDHEVLMTPQKDLKEGEWKTASESTIGSFSAVAYFFAKDVYQKIKVPIGIINSSWGGSQVEGWISKEGMLSSQELKKYAETMPDNWLEADARIDKNLRKNIFNNANFNPTEEFESNYTKANYDFSKWKYGGSAIGSWDWKGIWAFRGKGFMAIDFDVTSAETAQKSVLNLGIQDSFNEIYVNGKKIYEGILSGKRKIPIPENTFVTGTNKMVIKFGKMVDPAWYGMGIDGIDEDLFVAFDKTKVEFGSNWKLMPSFVEKHNYEHSCNNVGTTIYNGMIAPLIPYGIRGALWYQGESNAGRAYQYRQTFPLLINDWRKKWNDDFSFYFVQLSSYGDTQNSNEGSSWAELREAQAMTLSLPKTGMAVTTDIGNPKDIHPTNKQDVGIRLASIALKQDYDLDLIAGSPIFQSVKYKKGYAILTFKNVGTGLIIKDKYGYLKGFEAAGKDKIFYHCKAEIIDGQVHVYFPKKEKPIAVRMGWSDATEDPNLFNSANYPVSPFRTDNWKGLTEGVKFE